MEQELSKEIISAEIVFSQQYDMSKIALPENIYSQELSSINESLEKYANHADRYDYMVAVASGILCGVLDAQVADVSRKVLDSNKSDLQTKSKEIAKAIAKNYEKNHDKTSIEGIASAVLKNCLNTKAKDIITTDKKSGIAEFDIAKAMNIFGGAAITALLKWIAADRKPEEIDNSNFPDSIKKLLHLLNDHPKVREFLKNPYLPEINAETLEKLGVPVIFITIVESKLPELNQPLVEAKNKAADFVNSKKPKDKKCVVPMDSIKKAGNQAFAVLANEIFVRGFYFVRHLMMEMERCGDIESVDWSKVIPYDNKTVTRMMSIASLTFTAADMTSAAVRAAIESGGNPILFKAKYAANINVIGVGRAIIAVTKDVSMEWQEADLIRERRILMEKMSAEQVEAILDYRKQMEAVVEEYLAEDLQAFLTGADEIEEGLAVNDSDRVIHGNVTIQRVLGRKPQFTNQAEFDDLMDSMDALVL